MLDVLEALPDRFWDVPYDGRSTPHNTLDPAAGANCQVFAYAVLRHFGTAVPPMWSSQLWTAGQPAELPFRPLDLLLFNGSFEPFGAHVTVSLGGERALHLSQRLGRPAVWSLSQFAACPDYRVLLGGRRFA